MADLGDLGVARVNDAITFSYFGESITADPGLTDLHYIDFMEKAAGMAVDDPRSLLFLKDFGRACLAPGEFDRFWAAALANRQSQEDVFAVLMKVLEAATGRPTVTPSDSSPGQPPTAESSTASSSSAQERLSGRPDLQLFVQQAEAARAS